MNYKRSTRRASGKSNSDPQTPMKAVEARFHRILGDLRGIRPNTDKGLEQDIAYLIHKIQSHGFEFFPNHYIFDDVLELEYNVKLLRKARNSR